MDLGIYCLLTYSNSETNSIIDHLYCVHLIHIRFMLGTFLLD